MEDPIRHIQKPLYAVSKVYNTRRFWKISNMVLTPRNPQYTIWYDEDVLDLRSIETEFPAIVFNDALTSEVTLSCEPMPKVNCFDDLYFFKDFENEFPAIVYNDSLTSKLDFLTEPTLKPHRIDEFDLKNETSLSKYDEEEQNVLYFNDLFPFNIIYPDDLKSDKENDDDKIDIKQSSRGNVINNDDGAYAHSTINTAYLLNEYRVFDTGINMAYLGVKIDNPNITMEEYIRLEEEKAHRHSKVYNWETTTYGKIWDNEDVHDLRSVEIEFPAISFNDTLTSKETFLCEPMELLLHLAAQDFPIIKPGIIYSLVNEDKKNNTFSLLIIPREVILNGKQSAEENDQQTQAKIHKMWLLCPPTALTATATAAQMKQITLLIEHIEIVKDDEVAIDDIPLSTKPLVIVEYQIDKDGRIGYFKLIRAGGSSKRYSSMIMMLQNIDREV
ncbi:hypothetical protein Tco_1054249 [Tanacetum coccineum]|uniref:Uncharacterized protein n=1 Tax=Tanacetum coccineum TaxID=301880 RepID=A0ABQ5GW85_9ASTR